MSSLDVITANKTILRCLKEDLECPVCLSVPRRIPIFQCPNGHIVCCQCHPNLTKCPVCRIKMGRNRNLIAEKLIGIDRSLVKCKFAGDGCKESKPPHKLKYHEDQCWFQPVNCPRLGCREWLRMVEVVTHMGYEHDIHYKSGFKAVYNKENPRFNSNRQSRDPLRPTFLWLGEDDFYFVTWRNESDKGQGQWFMWVYLVGFQSECEQYMFFIEITTADKKSLVTCKPVVPITMTKDEVMKKPEVAMTIDDKTAQCIQDGLKHDKWAKSHLTVKILRTL